jgi:hypothetical protein
MKAILAALAFAVAVPALAVAGNTTSAPAATVAADVKILPASFNLRSNGRFTVFVTIDQAGHSASEVNQDSIRITQVNGIALKTPVAPVRHSGVIGDNDGDGRVDLMEKFDRKDLRNAVDQSLPSNQRQGNLTLTVEGDVGSGASAGHFVASSSARMTRSFWGALWDSIFGTSDR